ncbi:MAG: hypothetical protein AAFO74_02225 [Pseudomonadota bacterium]
MIFDEISAIPEPLRSALIGEGMVFSTSAEILADASEMGSVIARDFEHARMRVQRRGASEAVMGRIQTQLNSTGTDALTLVD